MAQTSREFVLFLDRFLKVARRNSAGGLDPVQVNIIKTELNGVFHHEIDPSYSADPAVQQELNQIHAGHNVAGPVVSGHNVAGPVASLGIYGDGNITARC
jgi:hypothetical protein